NLFRSRNIHEHFDKFNRLGTATIILQGEVEDRGSPFDVGGELALIDLWLFEIVNGAESQWSSLDYYRLIGAPVAFRGWSPRRYLLSAPLRALPTDIVRAYFPDQI